MGRGVPYHRRLLSRLSCLFRGEEDAVPETPRHGAGMPVTLKLRRTRAQGEALGARHPLALSFRALPGKETAPA